MKKIFILLSYFLMQSCSQRNMSYGENKDRAFGIVKDVQGVVNYKFKLVDGGYCLKTIIFLPIPKKDSNLKFDEITYFYDERRKNYDLLKDDSRFEKYFGNKNGYLYNYEEINSKFNLRNSALLLNHPTLSPYYLSPSAYRLEKDPSSGLLIVSFNFSGSVNFYYNAPTWFEKDFEFYQTNVIDTIYECTKINFMSASNFGILNECDSVWPLSEKQIKVLQFIKSEIDSIPYGVNY
jgi:hypothetical protein